MKLVIVVTHLLGTGHLSRALTLGRAFASAGHEVTVASGGMPAPQLDAQGVGLVQLPPLRSDGTDFARLLDDRGFLADSTLHEARRNQLTACIRAIQPDAVMTELFPFGRRSLSQEFLAALDTVRNLPRRPLVVSSIRDILAPPSKPAKAERADEIIAEHYHAVLVHSDPSATPLELSWPVSDRLEPRLRYTGYVAPPYARPDPDGPGQGEIIVSAGGGAVGTPIFQVALEAAEATPEMRWRLLVGGNDAMDRISALASKGFPPNAFIEPARPDFRALLGRAAASVSMCGYNTAIDILQAGTPAVFVPFDDGQEVEQGLRARALAALPAVQVVRTSELTAHAIASAVRSVARAGPRETGDFAFDGAARSVSILQELLEKRA